MTVQARDRVLTELDYVRLNSVSAQGSQDRTGSTRDIDALLDEADVVPSRSVAPNIVTMYSQVLLRDVDAGIEHKLTLCYPPDADAHLGFVSVLSPAGLSLLGQAVGAMVRWKCPNGSERMATLDAILFQPEASGDFVT